MYADLVRAVMNRCRGGALHARIAFIVPLLGYRLNTAQRPGKQNGVNEAQGVQTRSERASNA